MDPALHSGERDLRGCHLLGPVWLVERAPSSDHAFVTALKHLVGQHLAMQAILEVQPRAVFVQSESSGLFHPEWPDCQELADS